MGIVQDHNDFMIVDFDIYLFANKVMKEEVVAKK